MSGHGRYWKEERAFPCEQNFADDWATYFERRAEDGGALNISPKERIAIAGILRRRLRPEVAGATAELVDASHELVRQLNFIYADTGTLKHERNRVLKALMEHHCKVLSEPQEEQS